MFIQNSSLRNTVFTLSLILMFIALAQFITPNPVAAAGAAVEENSTTQVVSEPSTGQVEWVVSEPSTGAIAPPDANDIVWPDANDKAAQMRLPDDMHFKFLKWLEKNEKWEALEIACTLYLSMREVDSKEKYRNPEMAEKVYKMKANSQAMQGEYVKAANTIRSLHAWRPNPKNLDLVMQYHEKDTAQKEFAAKAQKLYKEQTQRYKKILNLAKQREKLVQAALRKKSMSQKEIEKLQAEYKKLTAEIDKLKGIALIAPPKDVVLNKKQAAAVKKLADEFAKIEGQVNTSENNARKGLLEVIKKFELSWKGLEGKLTAIIKLQGEINSVQAELLKLMSSSERFSDAMLAKIRELKQKLDELTAQHDKLFKEIESAFLDTKVFDKLTPAQQKKFFELLSKIIPAAHEIWVKNKEINTIFNDLVKKKGFDLRGMSDEEYVTHLYNHILKREPEAGGFNYWLAVLKRGVPREQLVTYFFFSKEYLAKYDLHSMSDKDFVIHLYKEILGRKPDQEGFNNWLAALKAGKVTREQMVQQFMFSDEYLGIKPVPVEPTPNPRGGLCESCKNRMITEVYMPDAKCESCGAVTGHSAYKYCNSCSAKLNRCRMCGKLLVTAYKQGTNAEAGAADETAIGATTGETGTGEPASSLDQSY